MKKYLDKREERILQKITASVPQRIRKRLFIKRKPLRAEKEKIEERLKRRGVDGAIRAIKPENERKIRKILQSGIYEEESLEVNEKAAKEYELFIAARIAKAIKEGKLKPCGKRFWE